MKLLALLRGSFNVQIETYLEPEEWMNTVVWLRPPKKEIMLASGDLAPNPGYL